MPYVMLAMALSEPKYAKAPKCVYLKGLKLFSSNNRSAFSFLSARLLWKLGNCAILSKVLAKYSACWCATCAVGGKPQKALSPMAKMLLLPCTCKKLLMFKALVEVFCSGIFLNRSVMIGLHLLPVAQISVPYGMVSSVTEPSSCLVLANNWVSSTLETAVLRCSLMEVSSKTD